MPDDLVQNEFGIMKPVPHEHDWGQRPLSRWRAVKGFNGPAEEWVCACGVRRVVAAGVSPNAPVCDPRDVAYNEFQDHSERSMFYGTGQMGVTNPAMWLTEQEKANG
jgi:hypothetical protein